MSVWSIRYEEMKRKPPRSHSEMITFWTTYQQTYLKIQSLIEMHGCILDLYKLNNLNFIFHAPTHLWLPSRKLHKVDDLEFSKPVLQRNNVILYAKKKDFGNKTESINSHCWNIHWNWICCSEAFGLLQFTMLYLFICRGTVLKCLNWLFIELSIKSILSLL